jgi:hypothetical protein
MNTPENPHAASAPSAERAATLSALFASMVMQQTNMALMLLGKIPNPETGQPLCDLDAAQLMIDQLEMLETKTQGNLDADETRLLRNSLMTLRMAFVEAVDRPPAAAETPKTPPADPV